MAHTALRRPLLNEENRGRKTGLRPSPLTRSFVDMLSSSPRSIPVTLQRLFQAHTQTHRHTTTRPFLPRLLFPLPTAHHAVGQRVVRHLAPLLHRHWRLDRQGHRGRLRAVRQRECAEGTRIATLPSAWPLLKRGTGRREAHLVATRRKTILLLRASRCSASLGSPMAPDAPCSRTLATSLTHCAHMPLDRRPAHTRLSLPSPPQRQGARSRPERVSPGLQRGPREPQAAL